MYKIKKMKGKKGYPNLYNEKKNLYYEVVDMIRYD